MLKGKTILLGVSGSIAAYKAADLASRLVKHHADVHVIMTRNAANFINPITFEALTKNRCITDTFDRNHEYSVEHISLAKQADLALIAPATANVMAKLAHGIADDMLTTTLLACTCPVLIAPAMNTRMYEARVTQDNMASLEEYGYKCIEPEDGLLACGDVGKGKMADPACIVDCVLAQIAFSKDLSGRHVLVTAGPTHEDIDPVRFITNHSTGKMGYAAARMAMLRGADVTLVTGPSDLTPPPFVKVVPIVSAQDLFDAVVERALSSDYVIAAAAVADYMPSTISNEKIHKTGNNLSLALSRTRDTLQYLGSHKLPGQLLCGFAMETSDMETRAMEKLKQKNLDLIVANNVRVEGAGFGTDTNVVSLITRDDVQRLPVMSKEDVSMKILDLLRDMETQEK